MYVWVNVCAFVGNTPQKLAKRTNKRKDGKKIIGRRSVTPNAKVHLRAKHKVSLCECNGSSNEDTLASHLKMSDDDDEHNVKESIFGFYHLWILVGQRAVRRYKWTERRKNFRYLYRHTHTNNY